MPRLPTGERMRPRVRSLLALLSMSAVTIASPALAQNTAQRPEPQPTGSARITSRVLARDNGAPVRRAHVRLSGSPAETRTAGPKPAYVQREVETDDNGVFDFAGLPGGSYSISVPGTNGFLELPRAKRATVGEGQAFEVAIRLERTGAIVGHVADRNGEGLLNVEVQAIRRNDFRGHVTLMPLSVSRALTNDLGQFRLFNLSPGQYFVVATPMRVGRPTHARLGSTRRSGFVTTYYPGIPRTARSSSVCVRSRCRSRSSRVRRRRSMCPSAANSNAATFIEATPYCFGVVTSWSPSTTEPGDSRTVTPAKASCRHTSKFRSLLSAPAAFSSRLHTWS